MTKARQHLPGEVVLLTRRTEERRFFLRPDTHCRRVIMYEMAKASEDTDVDVHGLMTMGNHPHIAATDRRGERSDFMRRFCAGVARARNCRFDRKGHFWDTQQFGDTVLPDLDTIERKLLYLWLNPVKAGLVARAEDWPGAKILPKHWGKEMVITTPNDGFYNQKRARTIKFTPMPPDGYEHMTLEEVIAHFEKLLADAEEELRKRRRRAGKKVLGKRRALLRLNPLDAPGTRASSGKLNPRFATRDRELMKAMKEQRKAFLAAYEEARDRLKRGERDVVFPAGTIQLRKTAYVACAAPTGCECTAFAA